MKRGRSTGTPTKAEAERIVAVKEGPEWRPVVGITGYEVSSHGQVRSLDRIIPYANGRDKPMSGRIRKLVPHTSGYLAVCLSSRHLYVHRIVAEAFVSNPDGKRYVNHIDGDKANNLAANLEWVTATENNIHARDVLGVRFGGDNPKFGEENWNSKPIERISRCGEVKRYECLTEAQADGFSPSAVSNVANGKRTQHKGFYWRHCEK